MMGWPGGLPPSGVCFCGGLAMPPHYCFTCGAPLCPTHYFSNSPCSEHGRFATFAPRSYSTQPPEASHPAEAHQSRQPALRKEVFERVKDVLVEQLGIEENEITGTASFQDDLDADSLDLVELIMELEDQFGIKISDEDAQKITSVGQVVDYVCTHQ
jgi:acyl carrier protein